MRPFFSYYGGKWRTALKYPAPVHDMIVEPFAGGAGYSIRHYERDVLLVEADPKIAALWEYLIQATPDEIRTLPLYDGSWKTTHDLTHLPAGAVFLIEQWLNKGAGGKSPSSWMRRPEYASQFWGAQIRERVAAQVPLIKHWRVIHGDYRVAGEVRATWFIDPPYQVAGKNTYRFNNLDYSDLGAWARTRLGQVIVCEHEGAAWLPFQPFLSAHQMRGRHLATTRSAEAIWVSI